jgi:hypothetical protein
VDPLARILPTDPAGLSGQLMSQLTSNVLRVFGQGSVGLRYPSVANWQQFYR